MALTTVRGKLLAAVTDVSLLFVILNLCLYYVSAEQSGDHGDDDEDSSTAAAASLPMCHRNSFVCYQDCCLRGEWFCHHGQQKCYHCATRISLCGNESLPLACLLYCYKILNPPQQPAGSQSDQDSVCVPRIPFIAGLSIMVIAIVALILTLVAICVCARRTPPLCLRVLLGTNTQQRIFASGDQNEKDPNATVEENAPMLGLSKQTTKDVNAGHPQTDHKAPSSPSSTSRPPSSVSDDISNPPANVEDLNLTRVNDEDSDDTQQTTCGRPVNDGSPPTTTPQSGVSQGPGQAGGGSSGGRMQPPPAQGQELGMDTEAGSMAAGNHGRPATPVGSDGGHTPFQQGPEYADAGNRPRGNNRRLPPTGISSASEAGGVPTHQGGIPTHQGGAPTHQGPDPSRDFEVGSPVFPHRPPAFGRHVPVEGSHHPDSSLASPQPHGPQAFLQGNPAYNANEVSHKPDLSMINPTATPDSDDQRHVIAPTGTTLC